MGQARVLTVAWDGADRVTVDTLLDQGLLPNLARLRAHGSGGGLRGLPGLGDDAIWTSTATMVGPGVHGRFHHRQTRPHSYRTETVGRQGTKLPPFWELVARTGLRVAALDVPKSPMGHNRNLRECVNWMPHGEDPGGVASNPPGLAQRIAELHAPDASFSCHRVLKGDEVEAFRSSVLERLRLRARLALEWLDEGSWDLFLVSFAESHCIGHHCWHLHDSTHPAHDPEQARAIGDPVVDVYRAQDEALGRLVDAAGADASVFVFSPLGMGPNYSGDALIKAILRRLEGRDDGAASAGSGPAAARTRGGWTARLSSLGARLPGGPGGELKGRRYFAVPHDAMSSAIRLNVAGREPAGLIQPGSEYESACETLTAELRELRDPASGRPLVREVVSVADRYPGPFASRFADLLVVWTNDAPITAACSPAIGTLQTPPSRERTGNHREGGWYVLGGGDQRTEAWRVPRSTLDVGPAVAGLLGVTLPGAVTQQ